MDERARAAATPRPTDDEAAAIMVAIAHYLAGQRCDTPAPALPERRWALAGRLASQGQPLARPPGTALTWATAARLTRTRR